jgi:alpha-D-ribose 1-methylphosphonate 5-phosphate C-P lyase
MNTKAQTGVPQKRRIFLRVWEPEDDDPDCRIDYYAKIGKVEIEGWLYGADRDDVEEVVKRAVKAGDALPEDVSKAVDMVVNYLVAGVQLGLTVVAAAAGHDDSGLNFRVEMFYNDDGRWTVEVRALFERTSGVAVVKRRAVLTQMTAETLRKVVERVVRIAYNAHL